MMTGKNYFRVKGFFKLLNPKVCNIRILLILLLFKTFDGFSQAPNCRNANLEMFSASGNTSTVGPSQSYSVSGLRDNTNNPLGNTNVAYSPNISVSYAISNQQFTNLTGSGYPGGGPLQLGVAFNKGDNIFTSLNNLGSAKSSNFSSSPSNIGKGIDANNNYGVYFSTNTRALGLASVSTTAGTRTYMGDLTITFSSPVDNPILHFSDFGGAYSTSGTSGTHDKQFTTDYELTSPTAVITKLSGDPTVVVTGTNLIELNTTAGSTANSTFDAKDGSFQILQNGVTTLTFRIYNEAFNSDVWYVGNSDVHGNPTDAMIISATVPDQVPTAPLVNTPVSTTCPSGVLNLTGSQNPSAAGTTVEWHTVATNPNSSTLVADPTNATPVSGTFYLYAKDNLSGCYSLASAPVTGQVRDCNPAPSCVNANLEMAVGGVTSPPVGPSTAPVVVTMQNDVLNNGTYTAFNTQTVTYEISRQVYPTITATPTATNSGIAFGQSFSGVDRPVYSFLNVDNLGGTLSSAFTSNNTNTPGTGILAGFDGNSASQLNYGAQYYLNAYALQSPYVPTTNAHQDYGDLTITFNPAVNNPIMHLSDMGHFTTISGRTVVYNGEYELMTSGVTMTKLSGASQITVTNANDGVSSSAGTYINGTFNNGTTNANLFKDASIQINGSNITSLTFKVWLQSSPSSPNNATWSATSGAAMSGEASIMSFSIPNTIPAKPTHLTATATCPTNVVNLNSALPGAPPAGTIYEWHTVASNPSGATLVLNPTTASVGVTYYLYAKNTSSGCFSPASDPLIVSGTTCNLNISGNVFNDVDAGTVNGTGTNAGTLYASLLSSDLSKVIAVVPVNADGTYAFTSVPPGTYITMIDKTQSVVGQQPILSGLPDGWVNTGDTNTGAGPNSPDGISEPFTLSTTNITNVNFGIEQPPLANIVVMPTSPNPGGTTNKLITSQFGGSDTSPGIVSSIKILSFPTNATSITIGSTIFTDIAAIQTAYPNGIPTNSSGVPTVPISIDPIDGEVDVEIPYVTIDNAGMESVVPGKVTVPFYICEADITSTNPAPQCSGTVLPAITFTPAGGTFSLASPSTIGTTVSSLGVVTLGSNTTASNVVEKIYYSLNAECRDSILVTTLPIPAAPTSVVGSPSTICSGFSSILNGNCSSGTLTFYSDAGLTSLVTSPVSPSASTTYYASCVNGLCKSPSTSVTINVTQTPVTPTSASVLPATICSGQSATLNANCSTGTLTWYSNASLTTTIASTTVNPTGNTTYYAACVNGLCKSPSASVSLTVTPTPTAPTGISSSPATICEGQSATLLGTCSTGTLTWYSNIGLTTVVTLPVSPAASTTYYASCVNGLCKSSSVSATVNVTPLPLAPTTLSATPVTICSGGSSTLGANCASGTLTWYSDLALTTIVSSLVSPLTTTTYYASCVNGICKSSPLSIAVTVTPTPSAPTLVSAGLSTICEGEQTTLNANCTSGTLTWYSNAGLTSIVTSPVSPTVTSTYYAACVNGICISPASNIVITVNPKPASPTLTPSAENICDGTSSVLTASGCSGGVVNWYLQGSSTSLSTGATFSVSPSVTSTYLATCTLGSCTSDLSNTSVITVLSPPPSASISISQANICLGESITLTAIGCNSPNVLTWFKDGSIIPLATGLSVTDSPTASASYTASCSSTGSAVSCSTPASSALNVTVNPIPTAPTISPSSGAICSGQSISLTATGCTSPEIVSWSNGQTGSIISVSPSVNTSYTAICVNQTTGCQSVASSSVDITVTPTPSTPTGLAASLPNICSGESTVLSGTCSTGTLTWYSDLALTTTTSSTVSPSTTSTYYAVCLNGTCVSPSASILINVTATPSTPTGVSASPLSICSGASTTLLGTCTTGTLTWFSDLALTSIVSSLVSPVATTTYYASCVNGTCKSPSASVTITVTTTPNAPTGLSATAPSICESESSDLSASCSSGSLIWYTDAALTNVLVSTTVSPLITSTYYAVCKDGLCSSSPSNITITVTGPCEAPSISIVKGSSLSLGANNIANPGDIITYSYDVTNTGNVTLTSVNVIENATDFSGTGILPTPTFVSSNQGSSAGTLKSGEMATYTANYAITALDIAAGQVDNQAFTNGISPLGITVRDTSDTKNPLDYNETGIVSSPGEKDKTGTLIPESPSVAIVKGSSLNLGANSISNPGDIITFTYEVTNTGNVPLSTVLVTEQVSDFTGTGTLPTPTFVSSNQGSLVGNLLAGEIATYTATYAITVQDIVAGKVDNQAFVTGVSPASIAVRDTSDSKNTLDYNETGIVSSPGEKDKTGTPIPQSPAIAIVKGSSLNLGSNSFPNPGDIVTFTYEVTNTGNVPLTSVTVTEQASSFSGTGTLPAPSFVSANQGSLSGNLNVGEIATYTATYAITAADIIAKKIDNQAFTDGISPLAVAVKDTSDSKNTLDYNETGLVADPAGKDKTGTPIPDAPSISIVKGSSLNLGSNSIANPGDVITYSYDVTNTGNVTLTSVTATEKLLDFTGTGTLPIPTFVSANQGSSEGTLLVGEVATYTATYAITQADINAGKVDNRAGTSGISPTSITVTDDSDSKNPLDPNETGTVGSPTESDKTGTPIPENARISVIKGSSLDLGADLISTLGDVITYSYTVYNNSNVVLTSVALNEQLANFTGTGILPTPTFVSSSLSSPEGTLLVGESAIYTSTYAITAADITAGFVDNQVRAVGQSPSGANVSDFSDSSNPSDPNETGTAGNQNENDKTRTIITFDPPITNNDTYGYTPGVPRTVPPLENDINGDPADPTTIEIQGADSGSGGKILTVPGEGVWTVNPTTGAFTFTPEPTFPGIPSPVPYRVRDFQGSQSNVSNVVLVSSALSVELSDFKVREFTNGNLVSWKAKNEQGFDYFSLRRSRNFIEFSEIVKIKGTQNKDSYSFLDEEFVEGITYYQLKMVNKDGSFTLSNIISIKNEERFGTQVVYPNPSPDRVYKINTSTKFKEINLIGSNGIKHKLNYKNTDGVYEIKVSDSISSGVYFLQFVSEKGLFTKKIVLN